MRKRRTTRPVLRLLRLGLAAVAAGAGLWAIRRRRWGTC